MTSRLALLDAVSHVMREMDRNPSAWQPERLTDSRSIWRALLFCILSSQVRTHVAHLAVDSICSAIPFFDGEVCSTKVYADSRAILSSKAVGYRFPTAKALQISHSWFAFAQLNEFSVEAYFGSFKNDESARQEMLEKFPGLGLKQASMFLRDIGYAERLLVLDTHILWYFKEIYGPFHGVLTSKKYREIERKLLVESERFGVSPCAFDMAVWSATKALRDKRCMMQFA